MFGEKRSSNDPNPPFQKKEKEGEGRSKAWRSMEGKGEGSHAWWPMESSKLGGQWKVKEKSFSPLLIFPPTKFT
jgi:hypothetical protein